MSHGCTTGHCFDFYGLNFLEKIDRIRIYNRSSQEVQKYSKHNKNYIEITTAAEASHIHFAIVLS
jgi:hypothetical protein